MGAVMDDGIEAEKKKEVEDIMEENRKEGRKGGKKVKWIISKLSLMAPKQICMHTRPHALQRLGNTLYMHFCWGG